MRKMMLGALLCAGLSGCGQEAAAPPPADAPILMQAGEWMLTRRTTGYNTPTVTPTQYQAALKTVREDKVCIALDDKGLPNADALAGADGTDCTYKEPFVRGGRLIATLACKTAAGTSDIMVEGNYTADTLTLGSTTTKTQGGQTVERTTHDVTGKRIGDCPKA